MNKPFSNYPGGKEAPGVYQTIINQIPPHVNYIEGFVGNGSVLRHKKPAQGLNLGIDISRNVIGGWLDLNYPDFEFQLGSWFQFVTSQSFKKHLNHKETFMFLDPPYRFSSRKSGSKIYEHELTDSDHDYFLELVKQLDCKIAITHYPDSVYERELSDWRCIEFTSQTRQGKATELLFMNYDSPVALHDYSHLGADYREREKIRKKINRWLASLDRMPKKESLAIISAINERIVKGGSK
ncbi:MAG: DNA adenine methylase [Bacteroidetes bacterium]|nr:MAG: DNA adenine methylase [Bacteroidota bacterium]